MRIPALALLAACTGGPTVPPIAADPPPAPLPANAGVGASYTVSFRGAAAQYLEVEAVFPATGDRLDLFVAAWTPGSYRIRDYAKDLEGVRATTPEGVALPIRKTDVHRWQVDTAGAGDVVVRYEVYASGDSVRDNRVEADHAILNGAPTFLAAVDRLALPHDVRLQTPEAWPGVAATLPAHPSGEARRYRAPTYDVLVDSPILAGDLTVHEWSIDGVPHKLASLGAPDGFPHDRAAADVEAISRANVAFWGGMPYRDYTFLNVYNGQRGGLEHAASTLMFADADIRFDDDAWKRWLALVSHEFFHTWNVKRLRPVELGPFDYERPVLTRSLWISEGLTTYYADLLLARAGLLSESEWLGRMSGHIEKTERAPGARVRSLEQASEDAWIKYYQRDANHDNTSVDYYGKGAVVGFLLDARIRRDSRGWASLDDAMRLAYSRHSAEQGFTPEAFQEACEEVASKPLGDFFDAFVRGTDPLDYQPALDLYGLRFAPPPKKGRPTSDLGFALAGGSVSSIRRDGPAWGADIILGDELIAIDGRRVRDLAAATRGVASGDEVELILARRGHLRTTRLRAAAPDDRASRLAPVADAPIEARSQRARLLDQARPGSPEARSQARAATDASTADD
jgi:predicted metalloprotease with PDZ domain